MSTADPVANGGSALRLPVLIQGWQISCCGDPPGTGDRVSWRLRWTPEHATPFGRHGPRVTIRGQVERLPEHTVRRFPRQHEAGAVVPAVLRRGGISVFWPAPDPPPTTAELTGMLHEDHHAGIPLEVPRTGGVLLRVRLVSSQFIRDANGTWRPMPGTEVFTDVQRAPRHLAHAQLEGPDPVRREHAVLADLEVPG